MKLDKFETNPKILKRVRLKKVLHCDRCPPHAKENEGRKPRPDKHKNHRRSK